MDNILSDNFILDDFNPTVIARIIASNLKKRRIELNITQLELAKKSSVSLGSIKRFESSTEISLRNLLLLAIALRATQEFKLLFSKQQYASIDELTKQKNINNRKRARRK